MKISLLYLHVIVSSFLWYSGGTSEVVEVPISSKSFFFSCPDVFLHHAEQNGANFFFLVQTLNFQSGEKSRFEKLQNSPRGYGSSVTCDVQPGLQSL